MRNLQWLRSPQWSRWLSLAGMLGLLCLLLACGSYNTNTASQPAVGGASTPANSSPAGQTALTQTASTPVTTAPAANNVNFAVSGEVAGTYIIASTTQTSKLRHGHREFTLDVEHGDQSFIMAFYGYDGPGSYTLNGLVNGGDVRIALGKDSSPALPTSSQTSLSQASKNTLAWDLPQRQGNSCTLQVISQTPTQLIGTDRLIGTFSCPTLASINPAQKPIALNDGHFDLLILIES